jgi:hypothetical protein
MKDNNHMRILILSDLIEREQSYGDNKYIPPYDVHLAVGNPNQTNNFDYSLFDYDVAIIHIRKSPHHSIGYYENIPKILDDAITALAHGRTVICIPESRNFRTERLNKYGAPVYDWLKNFGVELRDNKGNDIKTSGAGVSKPVKNYLSHCSEYHQIVISPEVELVRKLAVVSDTDIVVGMEYQVSDGVLVILPPPNIQDNSYQGVMYDIEQLSRRYFEHAKRSISITDAPDWVSSYLVKRAKEVKDQIKQLKTEKLTFDRIAYVLYGTGDELEKSVALLFEQLGLQVEKQPRGANIDIKAKHSKLGIGFAIEVTGIKGTIRKRSNKVTQAWQHISDSKGTEDSDDRIVIVANTECHLHPNQRNKASFSSNVVGLLQDNGVLLITTMQLYDLWRGVHEGNKKVEEVLLHLYNSYGLYKLPWRG